ncbi:pyridoxamine 5'-phosphate oxidase [Paraburkholderia sp. Ac-20340]|uniref:HugZ family pyridoxamine 5'-phosphate oxidase n=1 Tax=Paraburkholderia sp. Ac-20340 TaxID=2703888 RepID=UPI00197F317C|nr:pyridoxamine 5'-phosphate oxidase family protein [Paraburkholderia sp. Ac-20340]MBN3854281.1 pyridoxamine 5'-phosphate oxidase [Paraburkholderia sp. Ac-20340]
MKIPAHAPLHLLHQVGAGTLATHARDPHGFPYPTLLPFATDAQHRPVILVSRLAEHTRNLQGDPRAGFLVAQTQGDDVLNAPRMTLLGLFEPTHDDAGSPLARRYLRYHPDAARYLALGDFTFWTLHIERLRYIGGFGAMGWLDGADLDTLEPLAAEEEEALIRLAEVRPAPRDRFALLGVDRYGADLLIDGQRTREVFETPQRDAASLHAVLADCLARYSD